MNSKIKIKMGAIEIEYEGSEAFLKEELPELLSAVSELHKSSGYLEEQNPKILSSGVADAPSVSGVPKKVAATTSSIAAKINAKSGPELVIAAAARLTFALGSETFTRSDIADEMKSASAYYKQTYLSNLSSTLNRLVKDNSLYETSKNTYSLSAAKRTQLEAKIAEL